MFSETKNLRNEICSMNLQESTGFAQNVLYNLFRCSNLLIIFDPLDVAAVEYMNIKSNNENIN